MNIHALILAGGQATRMGGVNKGLQNHHGLPLIDHVIKRISPQVNQIAISANQDLETFSRRSTHLFTDARQWKGLGPLAAIGTAANDLQLASADWVLIVPCDTPDLPADLTDTFLRTAKRTPLCSAFYAETPVRPHYSIMFIRPQILQSAVPYLTSGMRTIRGWLQQQRARSVMFESEKPFKNINTLEELNHD